MSKKINKITMTGFRGATLPTEIPFDTSKAVTLIFGENGTGKSTIADAFAFICNRSYGSIENYSLGLGEQPKKHMASLGGSASDLKVSLSCASSTWTATLTKEGPVVSPADGCPNAHILHRKSILKLIEAQPKQRYDAVKTFIAVPGIEKSESALREAFKTTETGYTEAVRALEQANHGIESLWAAEGKPGKTAIEWGKKEAERNADQLQARVTALTSIENAFQSLEVASSGLTTATTDYNSANEVVLTAEAQQRDAEKAFAYGSSQLVQILKEAKEYISDKGDLYQCPVCEKNIERADLLGRLDLRINEMQRIVELASLTMNAREAADKKKTLLEEAQKVFCEQSRALAGLLKSTAIPEIQEIGIEWTAFHSLLTYEKPSETIEQQGRQFSSLTTPCRKPLLLKKDKDQKSINQHNAIEGHIDTLREKLVAAENEERLLNKLKAALEILTRQRKSYVETILENISDEVQTIYTRLHPGEGIGEVRFFLKPNAIGSLEFDASFQNKSNLPPQAYYSESHLDTLGICVFLALANRFKNEDTVIVLDDVLTSIDGPHLDRFMGLLHDQASCFNQVIVTTHYRPWRDRYRWAKGPTASTQVIELGPWTLQNGMRTGEFLSAIAELRECVKATKLDRQIVASKAGIVLESLLDFLTLKYRCKVPRNTRNEYTLGDLSIAIDSKLGKELRTIKSNISDGGRKETFLRPLIEACTSEQWIRNSVGCHFTALGSEVSDPDVRSFCKAVLALSDEIVCGSCSMLPTRRPSGSNWQCSCGQLMLFPLVYPGSDPGTVDDEG